MTEKIIKQKEYNDVKISQSGQSAYNIQQGAEHIILEIKTINKITELVNKDSK